MTDPAAPEPPARAALFPDVPVALGKLVRRVLCGNPGMMTGPGTNTYLVGIDEVAVIDPGPDDAGHVGEHGLLDGCLLYTSPSPRDRTRSRMPSSA